MTGIYVTHLTTVIPGLTRDPAALTSIYADALSWQESGTPDQVRGDGGVCLTAPSDFSTGHHP